MTYRQLSLCCDCGRPPYRIKDVGFTADHQLVVHWWCSGCRRNVYAFKPLAECWRRCPAVEKEGKAESVAEFEFGPDDVKFLHCIGAALPVA
ncbi:MAG TPA: hypothetical protein VLY04_07095 [Bryobacteraceae bacterium]|nr:hypothetical protein [Bryobacteraceae bacterium]